MEQKPLASEDDLYQLCNKYKSWKQKYLRTKTSNTKKKLLLSTIYKEIYPPSPRLIRVGGRVKARMDMQPRPTNAPCPVLREVSTVVEGRQPDLHRNPFPACGIPHTAWSIFLLDKARYWDGCYHCFQNILP